MADEEDVQQLKITKKSKPIGKLKKGDKLFINGKPMTIDSQYVFMDHGNMKEMIIEFFNPENEREYQLRYFDDQIDSSIEVYELQGEFQYVKREPKSVGW
jgi:predicted DNA-binding protein with PD1-like motif